MGLDIKWTHNKLGFASRSVALRVVAVFLGGTLVGSLAPELGTIVAHNGGVFSHVFNPMFLALGIVGIGLALFVRPRKHS